MKTFARIDGQVVAELLTTDLDIAGRYNPALIWIDVSSVIGISPGWQQSATGFFPPPVPPAPIAPSLAQLQTQLSAISVQIAALSAKP